MKIIFIDTTHPKLIEDLKCEGFICDEMYDKSKSEILKIIKNYDGLVIRSRFKIDQTFINAAKNLKFIARAGSGTENIDLHYTNKKNIKCFNAAEGNRQAVAEHAVAMILNLLNNIRVSDQEIRNGIWNREKNRGFELSGKTIGIIGFGNTGSSFAKILENFNVKILVYDKYKKNYKFKSNLDKILEFSDIISLHIPLTEETKYLVNKSFIDKAKKPFYIINTSRGQCIETNALIKGLNDKKILGACLDVFEQEKNSFEKISKNADLKYLIESSKTILTPHIAGWTFESNYKIAVTLSKKIINLVQKS
ncbi:hydroxyacid dehydrogenase [Flavobacteriales bacterium]|nr:hydroxyacid dehydrogenase [Flavobacteriales bacterium]